MDNKQVGVIGIIETKTTSDKMQDLLVELGDELVINTNKDTRVNGRDSV